MKNAHHYWSKHITAIKRQGVTTSAYARQHNLALASLYYWQHKLRSTTAAGVPMERAQAPAPPSKFIALTVSDPVCAVSRSEVACTLVLAGGMRLQMNALPDPQWLAALG